MYLHYASIMMLISGARGLLAPCAKVSASWAAQATDPPALTRDHRPQVPAQDAFDCLKSVPVNEHGDLREIEELREFLQFQTSLRYLKGGRYVNDKVEVHNHPLDIEGRLIEIADSIKNRTYRDEYSVQLGIHNLLRLSGDFHLRFRPDMFEIFLFVRPESQLVSISEDGASLPQLYLVSDLKASSSLPNFTPSPLNTINGLHAAEYLENLWTHNVYHDADARYNSFFPNPAAAATLDMDSGGQFYLTQGLYDGPTTEFGFVNGSHLIRENVALIREYFDFSGVTDGPSFFSRFCQGKRQATKIPRWLHSSTSATVARESSFTTSILSATGYPRPINVQSGLSLQGYHLNSRDYHDVAVLALPNLRPSTNGSTISGFLESQQVLRNFIRQSKNMGKTKLIIDLRGNSGGAIDMAYELFRQLFPDIEPFGASRFVAHEAFRLYSSSVADLAQNKTVASVDADFFTEVAGSTANFANLLNLEGAAFPDFATYYGPYEFNGVQSTAAQRYNFSNHFGGHTLAPHVNISGHGFPQDTVDHPFEPENMVLLQDGFCGSACSLFSQFMREQGRVQTIAIGGRPRNSPMQGVGGTRGAQMLTFDAIIRHMNTTLRIVSLLHGPEFAQTLLREAAVGRILNSSELLIRSAHFNSDEVINGAVNSLESLRQSDPHGDPLEFVYQTADCRLFYTKESFFNPVSLWEMAAGVKWGKLRCVAGSEGHATAVGVMIGVPFNISNNMISGNGLYLHVLSGVLLVLTAVVALLHCHVKREGWTPVAADEM